MKHLLAAILLKLVSISINNILVESFDLQSIENDLIKFNISCTNDNCQSYDEDSLVSRACHCGMHCVELGTCCFDSPYANVPQPKQKPVCRYLHGGVGYFIVDQCPFTDSVWAIRCNDESSEEEEDDMQKLVPVTSLITSVTYKNYFCFRCHESTDEFLFWTINIKSDTPIPKIYEGGFNKLGSHISLTYDKHADRMMVYYDGKFGYNNVLSSLQIPSEIRNITYACDPDVISDCSDDWPDNDVKSKCESYMALKSIDIYGEYLITYKNIHCAICNYENLTDINCKNTHSYDGIYENQLNIFGGRNGNKQRGQGVYRFTFTYVLDVNPYDGELVGMIQKCAVDHIWDPFTNKCRKLICALPGFKIKKGRCVAGDHISDKA